MPLTLANRVKESSLTTGTGTISLQGAVAGYQSFSSALSNSDTTYYTITNGNAWEVGLGTYSSNTLTRDTVLSSSNSDAKLNLSGQSYVFIAYPAERSVYQDANDQVVVGSSGIVIDAATPPSTTSALYNLAGTLYFDGMSVAPTGPTNEILYYGPANKAVSDSSFVWNSGSTTLTVNGHIAATTKSFLIDHPIKESGKLQHACLEGPENGVYYRGKLDSNRIDLPDYWCNLVDKDSITVHLTPNKFYFIQPYVVKADDKCVELSKKFCGSYIVYGERKDVSKLQVEL